jgi:3-methyladenine DNA glycosylase AlkD
MTLARTDLENELHKQADPGKGKFLQRFFKTGKGEYAEGDVMLGINVPVQRTIARKYSVLPARELFKTLKSKYHEYRLTALLALVFKFQKSDESARQQIAELYLKHTKWINNWDLVDSSAPYILGPVYFKKPDKDLFRLAKSSDIWQRRIAILTTQYFIRQGDFSTTLKLAEVLLKDKHDLIHKAVGWMLREVGNRSEPVLEKFLDRYSKQMPRTMLRYSIEKLSKSKKIKYMKRS